MENDPKPHPNPAGNRPPPRPPRQTAIGLPDDDDFGRKRRVTITKHAEGEGKFIRESGGIAHYGHVIVQVEPNGRGKGVAISSEVKGGTIPDKFIKPVTDMIREALDSGYGDRPVVDILVRIVGGSWDERASNELAFKMAGIFAIQDAVKKAKPIPIE
jgi:elongation factor G